MSKRSTKVLLTLAAALATLGATAIGAHAFEGVVRGRIQFYNNQGNFCPSFRDCSQTTYRQADFNRVLPIREARVYVVTSGGRRIGQGATDRNGNFTIRWSSGSRAPRAHIEWYGEHSGGRFAIRNSRGGRWVFWTANRTLERDTTGSRSQWMGNFVWGSATMPHALANLYDGAFRMWQDSLRYSNRMQRYFTDVEIRAFDGARCPTSCASGKRIIIDSPGSAFMPQGRVWHEMGHVASTLSMPGRSYRFCGQYGSDNAWSLRSSEAACASFEEGVATFFGDTTVYWAGNPAPHTCLSSSFCPAGLNVESTTGFLNCRANQGRQALTIVKYLRDLYDNNDAAESVRTDQFGVPYFNFFDALNRFGNGTDNTQKNEPWTRNWLGIWNIDDRDGRSSIDFSRLFRRQTGLDDGLQLLNNCATTGD